MKLDLNPRFTPTSWIAAVIANADPFSTVLQTLIHATLRKRFPDRPIGVRLSIPATPRTPRVDSLTTGVLTYHIAAAPSAAMLQQCAADCEAGLRPYLLVPYAEVERAKRQARRAGLYKYITVSSIESFVGLKVILMSCDVGRDAYDILADIIALYNQRLADMHADPALSIQLN